MSAQLHFLGWHQPWTVLFTEWLLQEPEKLRHRLVVVPTRESGRRLRESLAVRSAQGAQGGILGPRIATPNDFFRSPQTMPEAVRWAGWRQALSAVSDEEVQSLFPLGVGTKAESWRHAVARRIERVRDTVAASDMDFAAVADRLTDEADRWRELTVLEQRATAQWQAWGFADPVAEKRRRAAEPVLPNGVTEVVVAGVADPTPLALLSWERLARRGVPVTILVGAPEGMRRHFDAWGRPASRAWSDRNLLQTPLPEKSSVAADANALARETVRLCAGFRNDQVAVGACDPTCLPALGREFRQAGWLTFNPEGSEAAADGWPELLLALAACVRAPDDYLCLARVARHPVSGALAAGGGDLRWILSTLDRWEREVAIASTRVALERLSGSGDLGETTAGAYLTSLAAGVAALSPERALAQMRTVIAVGPEDFRQRVEVELAVWPRLLEDGLGVDQLLTWLAETVSELREKSVPPNAALALQGWLELPFDPAPHLVLAGFHEGCVPEAPQADPLLSEQACELLGIRDRQGRYERDAFLYMAMVAGRRSAGSVAVVTAMFDGTGEPRNPSRILLQEDVAHLPARVERFIKERPDVPAAPTPPSSRDHWKLRFREDLPGRRPLETISPSRLKSYLACPTRYYFAHVLRWERHDPFEGELDPARFGDLMHQVLRVWGNDHAAREISDSDQLKACWRALLAEQVRGNFGDDIPAQLQLQVMSAEERLMAFAEEQVQARTEGWHVHEVELAVDDAIKLSGVPVHLRIDRVDRHESGRYRVIDYKTGDTAKTPRESHLVKWTSAQRPPALGDLCEIKGKRGASLCGWIDLQLPLYAAAIRAKYGLRDYPECWYAVLPKSVADAKFLHFEALAEERIMANALTWAETATTRIRDGVFWPPAPKVSHDLFEEIAPDGRAAALGPGWEAFLRNLPATP
jgi:ATP-dependent helicase/nuclease subunit B